MSRSDEQLSNVGRGGYTLRKASNAQAILIATGSEVELAVSAADQLARERYSGQCGVHALCRGIL